MVEDMNIPGWGFHELKGSRQNVYSITVEDNHWGQDSIDCFNPLFLYLRGLMESWVGSLNFLTSLAWESLNIKIMVSVKLIVA